MRTHLLNRSPWKVTSNGNIVLAVLGELREESGRDKKAKGERISQHVLVSLQWAQSFCATRKKLPCDLSLQLLRQAL